jgi:hypothetical protein
VPSVCLVLLFEPILQAYLVSSGCHELLFELCLQAVEDEHVQLELELGDEEERQVQDSIPYAAFW